MYPNTGNFNNCPVYYYPVFNNYPVYYYPVPNAPPAYQKQSRTKRFLATMANGTIGGAVSGLVGAVL